jgi:hypothetical protein
MGKMRAENGHPEPFNVRLWTIGNEMYGDWQFGYMSLDQYWVKHNLHRRGHEEGGPEDQGDCLRSKYLREVPGGAEKKKQFLPEHLGGAHSLPSYPTSSDH